MLKRRNERKKVLRIKPVLRRGGWRRGRLVWANRNSATCALYLKRLWLGWLEEFAVVAGKAACFVYEPRPCAMNWALCHVTREIPQNCE